MLTLLKNHGIFISWLGDSTKQKKENSMSNKKITITATILDGNLGDGFESQTDAAYKLANFMEAEWRSELEEYTEYEVNVDVDVQENTSGCCSDMEIIVEDDDGNRDIDLESEIEQNISTENELWESFCN